MELFKPEQINKVRKEQTRELIAKNDRLAKSMRKLLGLQKDIEYDADKAKKVKEYQIWCEDLQKKMDRSLGTLKAYDKLLEEKKEQYYELVAKKDAIEDNIMDLKEELDTLELQINFKKELLNK